MNLRMFSIWKMTKLNDFGCSNCLVQRIVWWGGENEGKESGNINSCAPVGRNLERTPRSNLLVYHLPEFLCFLRLSLLIGFSTPRLQLRWFDGENLLLFGGCRVVASVPET